MPRNQCKNKSIAVGIICRHWSSATLTSGPGYSNIAKAQERDLETVYTKMIEVLKEESNKTECKEIKKIIQDLKMELEEKRKLKVREFWK